MKPDPTFRAKVVIAEDFVLIQESIRRATEDCCEVVAVVQDGEEALDAVATHSPDVLLLDASLPGKSGFAVAQTVLGWKTPVKIIFVSAHAERAYVERAFEIGASGYVLKSAVRTELPEAIRSVLAGGLYLSSRLA